MAFEVGHTKAGGRTKGVRNKINIQDVLRKKQKEGCPDPITVLCDVLAGKTFKVADGSIQYPTIDQRLRAAELIAKKLYPDLKSVEAVVENTNDNTITIELVKHDNIYLSDNTKEVVELTAIPRESDDK